MPATADVLIPRTGYAVIRFALSVLSLAPRPGLSKWQKLISLVVDTPAAVLLNILLLMPTRYYALVRLRDERWLNRQLKPGRARASVG